MVVSSVASSIPSIGIDAPDVRNLLLSVIMVRYVSSPMTVLIPLGINLNWLRWLGGALKRRAVSSPRSLA